MTRTVTLYARANCHLCDDARAVILRLQDAVPFGFEEVLIDGDQDLEETYGQRIPVVTIDGAEEFELSVDPVRLRELLRR